MELCIGRPSLLITLVTASSFVSITLQSSLSQHMRTERFKSFEAASDSLTLFCTNVAARGWDIPSVRYIVHFDPPSSVQWVLWTLIQLYLYRFLLKNDAWLELPHHYFCMINAFFNSALAIFSIWAGTLDILKNWPLKILLFRGQPSSLKWIFRPR